MSDNTQHTTQSDVQRDAQHTTQRSASTSMQLSDRFEVMLITGMSGAGRSHAANALEDMGWYVIDNLPPKLLIPLVDMMTSSGSKVHKLAAVIDVRSRGYFDDLFAVLAHIDDLGVKTRILFLDASDAVLIKRYESVRRPHPLQRGGRLIDGILEERELLSHLKDCANIIIDLLHLVFTNFLQSFTKDCLEKALLLFLCIFSALDLNTACQWTLILLPICDFCRILSGFLN